MTRTIPRGWQELEIKDFLKFTSREVEKPKVKYCSLGIRSHCKGTFVREVENPDKVMMETLYAVRKDDLIVNITFAWEGAVALVNKSDEGALVSHRFPTYVFDRNMVVPEYFRYLIPSKRFVKSLGIISPGGAGRNRVLDRKDFLHLRFIMPPVEEQKTIAEILLTWDRAIETIGKLIDAKTRLKKGLMQILLTGKMRFDKFKNDNWIDIQMKNVGKVVTGNTPPKADIANYGTIFSWATADDFKSKYVTNTSVKLSEKGKSFCRILPKGSVLVTCIASIGKNAIAGECLATNQQINAVIVNKNIYDNEIIYYVMELHKRKMLALAGKTAVPIINKSTFEKMRIHLPENIAEQKLISRILASIDREIEILIKKRDRLGSQRKGLMQKFLTGKIRVKGVTQ